MRAGFIGLGNQGGAMARRLGESGIPTTVWARRPEASAPYAAWGAAIAETPAGVGAASDVVGLCVFDAGGVQEVVFGANGVASGMRAGGVLVVHSTVSPVEIKRIAARAADLGLGVVDAPVSGGGKAAATGELLVMLGGPDDLCEMARPVVEAYAGRVVRCGEVGAAQAAKLVNNAVFAANVALTYDALRMGAELGIEDAILEVIRAASGRSYGADVVSAIGPSSGLAAGPFGAAIEKDLELLASSLPPEATPSRVIATAREFMQSIRGTASLREGATQA